MWEWTNYVINNCLLKDFLLFLSEATQKSVKIIWPGRYDLVQTQILNVFFPWNNNTIQEWNWQRVKCNMVKWIPLNYYYYYYYYCLLRLVFFTTFGILDFYIRNSYWLVCTGIKSTGFLVYKQAWTIIFSKLGLMPWGIENHVANFLFSHL